MRDIVNKIAHNTIFKDSFWAVFGNGLGNTLLLIAGIVIARLLGKDIYGEYGVVKTTMFHIASFATLGLGFSSTKFVAQYKSKDTGRLKGTIKSSLAITSITSSALCILLFCFSRQFADYLNEPRLSIPFKFLGIIIILRAVATTSGAILMGYKDFKKVGINTILSGLSMLLISAALTYWMGLIGSLSALMMSQLILCSLNLYHIHREIYKKNKIIQSINNRVEILKFTIPVALQELSYTLSRIGVTVILTKYGTTGEVGIYTAASQWNAIILFIPSLLSNVILSYLSSTVEQRTKNRIVRRMLGVNLLTSIVPFLIVYICSGVICSFYGASFTGMRNVLNILVFSTIFDCMSSVFQSNLISEGKNWELFTARTVRDITLVTLAFYVLHNSAGIDSAKYLAVSYLCTAVVYACLLSVENIYYSRRVNA